MDRAKELIGVMETSKASEEFIIFVCEKLTSGDKEEMNFGLTAIQGALTIIALKTLKPESREGFLNHIFKTVKETLESDEVKEMEK